MSELAGVLLVLSGGAGFVYFLWYANDWPGTGTPVVERVCGLAAAAGTSMFGLVLALVPIGSSDVGARRRRVLRRLSLGGILWLALSASYETWSYTGDRVLRRRQRGFVEQACPGLAWDAWTQERANAILRECYAQRDR